MDTIVYLSYECKRVQSGPFECKYVLTEHLLQDYRLIKIRVREIIPDSDTSSKPVRAGGLAMPGKRLLERLQGRRHRWLSARSRQRMGEELKQELAPLLQENEENLLCYDAGVFQDSWVRTMLPLPEFEAYADIKWVQRLLKNRLLPDFIVLGDGFCLQPLLWELAPHMKSILWIAPDREAEEVLEDFAERFYQETGLAIRLQFLQAGSSYGQLVIPEESARQPVNVLDFSKDKHIPKCYPPKGSVWYDMASDTDKERRIKARGLLCELISLRKQWKNL